MSDTVDASDDRRALLELLLAEDGLAVGGIESIPRRDPDAEPVLSFAQERLWFLEQLEAETAALSIRAALRLRGPLDVEVFRKSLDAVFVRHDSLRTHITVVGGVPKPQVQDSTSMPLTLEDFRDADDVDALLAAALAEEARRTFELKREFPITVRLIRVADDEYVVSVVMHHSASDGWSFQVFFADLGRLYTAFATGLPSPLPTLPIQYADYASWQRAWVTGENRDRQLDYWRNTLAGPLPTTEIPTDFIRPPTQSFQGGQFEHIFDPDTTAGVRRLAADGGATPFMVLLSAFSVLVGRHVDHDDLLIGTPVAGRVREELEGLIGMFLNTLVLRTDVSGDPTFAELVERVRDVGLGAFDHQDVSFEQLLAELQPPRDLSRTPLFQIFFNMQPPVADPKAGTMPGIEGEMIAQPDIGSKFDLTLYVDEVNDCFRLLLVYNNSLYRATTMGELFDQFVHLVNDVVADPRRPISSYSLVTPGACEVLPDVSAPLDTTWHGSVPSAVRRAATRTPEHPAVIDAEVTWSYRALQRNMDRLAAWLVDHDVGKGKLVAIYGHRSASLVCAVTGALASGAGYLLLDPKYPVARLSTILRIARPDAWLEIAAAGHPPAEIVDVLDELGVAVRRTIPRLDELDASALDELPPDATALEMITNDISPDDFACLTFTSGSTGEPKAIIGLHGSLTHFFPWQSERFEVNGDDRFSMLSGLAHDPIQRDMFWALWVGGTIVVPDPDEMATPGWLADWLRTQRVTVVHLTPAMGHLVADGSLTGRNDQLVPSMRKAFFLGDSLIRRDVAQFRALAPNVEIVTFYGATETQRATGHHVVDFSNFESDPHAAAAREVLPLGVGVPDSQVLVRTDAGDPAGIGEIGEIWFRSPHLARGYLNRPEETADRFSHADGDPADRYYRTGDRGRYLSNGEVEFFGRNDGQVKVRGFRIELGEVRAAIVDQPHVRDAVVRAHHEPASTRLVAYVVPADDDFDPPNLRKALRDRLPGHMIPADFVAIPRIPLTPNGKLDTAALPSPSAAIREISSVEPRDHLERQLVEWWGEVLGRSDIGIHDDFFDLGGYSLLATRLFALIEASTGRRIPVSTLFEAPTIAELADVLRGDEAPAPWSSLVPVQPEGTEIPFFYVAPYMISVLQFAHLGDELGDDQPLYGLQPQGLDGDLPIHHRIEDMAAHYIRELRDVQPMGPYRIGGHCSGTWVAFEMARQLEAAGERIDSLVLVDQGPPNADREPIKPFSYIVGRLRFYFRDGRLRPAMAWQARIIFNAVLLRRIGTRTVRYTEEVKASHRAAYQAYEGGTINHDIALIRSEESLLLADKDWYTRWDQKTTGAFHHCQTIGTHANLLEQPYVKMLADRIRWAFQLSHTHEEVA